jgi:hypothetical protein
MAQSNNIKKRMFEGEEPVQDQAGAENRDQEVRKFAMSIGVKHFETKPIKAN